MNADVPDVVCLNGSNKSNQVSSLILVTNKPTDFKSTCIIMSRAGTSRY